MLAVLQDVFLNGVTYVRAGDRLLRKDAFQMGLFGVDPTLIGLTPKAKQRERLQQQYEQGSLLDISQYLKPKAEVALKPKTAKTPTTGLKPKTPGKKDGQRKVVDGTTFELKNSRWHKVEATAATEQPGTVAGLQVIQDDEPVTSEVQKPVEQVETSLKPVEEEDDSLKPGDLGWWSSLSTQERIEYMDEVKGWWDKLPAADRKAALRAADAYKKGGDRQSYDELSILHKTRLTELYAKKKERGEVGDRPSSDFRTSEPNEDSGQSLGDLFLDADRIGNKYQTPEEIATVQQKLSDATAAVDDAIDEQYPDTDTAEAIDYSRFPVGATASQAGGASRPTPTPRSSIPDPTSSEAIAQRTNKMLDSGRPIPAGVMGKLFPETAGTKEGDRRTVNGRTYELRDGRWHRVDGGSEVRNPTPESVSDEVPDHVKRALGRSGTLYDAEKMLRTISADLNSEVHAAVMGKLNGSKLSPAERRAHAEVAQRYVEQLQAIAQKFADTEVESSSTLARIRRALPILEGGAIAYARDIFPDRKKFDAFDANPLSVKPKAEPESPKVPASELPMDDSLTGFGYLSGKELDSAIASAKSDLVALGYNSDNYLIQPVNLPPSPTPEEPPLPAMKPALGGDVDYQTVSGQKTRLKVNEQVRSLLAQGKDPASYSEQEQVLLAKYSGKGGLGDQTESINEYYTRPDIAELCVDILRQHGFEQGSVLEPSCGSGVFLGALNKDGVLPVGVEMDATSSACAAALNPHAHVVQATSFERFLIDNPDTQFEAVTGNVPFGTRIISSDMQASQYKLNKWKDAGDLFVSESMLRLAPNGVMSLIVPRGVVSGAKHETLRQELMKQGRVVGVYRLPNTAFKHAGSPVVTDILVMQRHPDAVLNAIKSGDEKAIAATADHNFVGGGYFNENPDHILGAEVEQKRGSRVGTTVEGTVEDAIAKARSTRLEPTVTYEGLDVSTDAAGSEVGDTKYINGTLYRLEGNPPRWHVVEDEHEDAAARAQMQQAIDPSAFGVESMAEASETLADAGKRVMIDPEHLQAYLGLAGEELSREERAYMSDAAIALNSAGISAERQKIAHAMLLAGHIKEMQSGHPTEAELQQALGMLQRYRELHGNPMSDRLLKTMTGQFSQLFALQGAFDETGRISDYFADPEKVAQAIDRTSQNSAAAAMSEAFRANGGEPVELEDVRAAYGGELGDDDLTAALLADSGVGYYNGQFQPSDRLLRGNGYELMDNLAAEAETLPEDSPKRRKLEEQMGIIRARLQPRAIEDMTTPFWAIGSWISMEAFNAYMVDIGYDKVELTADGYEFAGEKNYHGGLESDILTWMNRGRISHGKDTKEAKDAVIAAEASFRDWLAGSDYRIETEEAYNLAFTGDLPQDFSGEPLDIDGIEQYDGDPENGIRKKRLHHYQNSTIRQMAEQGRGIVALGVGLGKAQPLDAKILTPSGWTLMGDIQAGDEIINSQGGISKVTGVFPQGEKDIFEVVFKDGSSTECCDEHLWSVWESHDLARGYEMRTLTLRQIMDAGVLRKTGQHRASKWAIPSVKPIEFPAKKLPIHPYLLGALLGDGNLPKPNDQGFRFSSVDQDLIEELSGMLPSNLRFVKAKGDNCDWRISKIETHQKGYQNSLPNLLTEVIRDLGLYGLKSDKKFIPDIYKFAPIGDRIALLQGLMDTDGSTWASKRGATSLEFCTTSEQLARDFEFLVQSLGGMSVFSSRTTQYTHKGEKLDGLKSYRVRPKFSAEIQPFRLLRKAISYIPPSKYPPIRFLKEVNHVGRKVAQCIMVDAPDHLYVTDDCILTHNTAGAIALSQHLRQVGRSQKPGVVVPKSVLANWVREIGVWGPNLNVMILGQTQQFWQNGEPAWEVPGHKFSMKGGNPVRDKDGNYVLFPNGDKSSPISMSEDAVKKRGNLAFSDDDAATKQRKLQQLSQNSYDLVLMSEPVFQDIPLDPNREFEYLDEIAGKHLNPDTKGTKDKSYKLQEQIETRKRKLAERRGDKFDADLITWEDLGIDCVLHDEAHHLKNLFSTGSRTGDVAFLSTAESNRALDFYYKSKYTRDQNNNQNVYLLTATPTTNNPLEAYNMLQHVCPEEFEKRGIQNVDDFLQMFGKIESVTVPGVDLEVTEKNGLVGFKNLKDLRHLFTKYCRMQSAKDVGLPIPEEKTHDVAVDMTESQRSIYGSLRQRAQDLMKKGGGEGGEGEDHIFSVISDMDKAAIDLDYYNTSKSTFGEVAEVDSTERSPKIQASVDRVMASRAANKGKQIVFCDAIQLHEDLKRQYVAAGYPENEIMIVNAGTAKKSSDRQKISQAYNDGRISLVIGNTATMGEGMNFQIGTTDIHHLTTPWTPAAIEQRNGRGVRQGNDLAEVNCHYYHASKSFDLYRKGVLERKRGWIDDLWKGDSDEADNQNTGALSMDELSVMMSDDPDAARQQLAANKELQLQRFKEKQTKGAMRQFGQLQTMKLAIAKLSDEAKASQRGQELIDRHDRAKGSLSRNEHFPHKSLLDGGHPAYVGTDGTVITVGGHVQKEDGSVWRVTGINNQTQKMQLSPVFGSDYRPFDFDQTKSEDAEFKKVNARRFGVKPVDFNDEIRDRKLAESVTSFNHLRRLSPAGVDANREMFVQKIKSKEIGGYDYIPHVNPATGDVDVKYGKDLPEGAQILFPHDGDAEDKIMRGWGKKIAEGRANKDDYYYRQSLETMGKDMGFRSDERLVVEQKLADYAAEHKASLEAARTPKDGDTRVNQAGHQEVLRNGRWVLAGDKAGGATLPKFENLEDAETYVEGVLSQSGLTAREQSQLRRGFSRFLARGEGDPDKLKGAMEIYLETVNDNDGGDRTPEQISALAESLTQQVLNGGTSEIQAPSDGIPPSLNGKPRAIALFEKLPGITSTSFETPETDEDRVALALKLDTALQENAPANWVGDQARERTVKNLIWLAVGRDHLAAKEVFDILKDQASETQNPTPEKTVKPEVQEPAKDDSDPRAAHRNRIKTLQSFLLDGDIGVQHGPKTYTLTSDDRKVIAEELGQYAGGRGLPPMEMKSLIARLLRTNTNIQSAFIDQMAGQIFDRASLAGKTEDQNPTPESDLSKSANIHKTVYSILGVPYYSGKHPQLGLALIRV